MGYTTIEIRSYRCALFAKDANSAKVSLYNDKGINFATAYIRPESEVLPKAYQDSSGRYRLYYKRSALGDLVDMLRNEKPVYVHFWDGHVENTHIATSREPVGEEEDEG